METGTWGRVRSAEMQNARPSELLTVATAATERP